MIDRKTYNRRINRTLLMIIGAFLLLRFAEFVFGLQVSPSHCLMLGIALAIASFIYNFRPDLDLAFQIQRAKASSEDEFVRYFKLAAGGIFVLVLFISGAIVATVSPEINPATARAITFFVPPALASVSPMFIAIFRLLADSYRRI
ncbi:putative membrane protein [Rhizobium leguminosarum]|uniref:hypothetical protein n=1 Tax=Rhizobium leguminosarum TaxID=384 RepID=UPI001AE79DF1|nr:hypothetical protein [Rhizobium leguminosarum]MBP2490907.1 putative membrane protein [Rhizobium leguminosarum]